MANKKKCFLQYPCGKMFELRIPIIISIDEKYISILPDDDNYFTHAKYKFQINNLKVIEVEASDQKNGEQVLFISLAKKIHSIE
jgi:hypothetical protein